MVPLSGKSQQRRPVWALRVTVPALDAWERSFTLDAPSLQNITDHSSEISSRRQMLAFDGAVQGQSRRPLNDPDRVKTQRDYRELGPFVLLVILCAFARQFVLS